MRKTLYSLLAVAMVAVSLGLLASPASATGGGGGKDKDKVAICHATGSESNPYVKQEVAKPSIWTKGHNNHQDGRDIIPAFEGVWPYGALGFGYPDFPGQNLDKLHLLDTDCTPQPTAETGQDVTTRVDCEAGTFVTTTQAWEKVYSFKNGKWKLGEKVNVGEPVVVSRSATADELNDAQCAPPEQPEDIVTYSKWVDGDFECGDTEVTQTRTKSVVTHVYNEATRTWVPQPAVETVETQQRDLTDDETTVCVVECPAIEGSVLATNVDLSGWTLVPGNGAIEFVDGGIKLSTPGAWESVVIERSFDNVPLGEMGNTFSLVSDPDTSGFLLGIHITTDQGDIVYEPGYSKDFWSNSAILPPAGGGQGGPYATNDLSEAALGLTVSKVRVLYTSNEASSIVLQSATFGCTKYTFDFEEEPEVPEEPETPVDPISNPKVDVTIECGSLVAVFSNEVGDVPGKDFISNFRDIEVVVKPNQEPVRHEIVFTEDAGGGSFVVNVDGKDYTVITDCEAPVTTTPTAPEAPKAQVEALAFTGGESSSKAFAGLGVLAAGLALLGGSFLLRRREGDEIEG